MSPRRANRTSSTEQEQHGIYAILPRRRQPSTLGMIRGNRHDEILPSSNRLCTVQECTGRRGQRPVFMPTKCIQYYRLPHFKVHSLRRTPGEVVIDRHRRPRARHQTPPPSGLGRPMLGSRLPMCLLSYLFSSVSPTYMYARLIRRRHRKRNQPFLTRTTNDQRPQRYIGGSPCRNNDQEQRATYGMVVCTYTPSLRNKSCARGVKRDAARNTEPLSPASGHPRTSQVTSNLILFHVPRFQSRNSSLAMCPEPRNWTLLPGVLGQPVATPLIEPIYLLTRSPEFLRRFSGVRLDSPFHRCQHQHDRSPRGLVAV